MVALPLRLLLLPMCCLFRGVRLRVDWEPQLVMISIFRFRFPVLSPSQRAVSSPPALCFFSEVLRDPPTVVLSRITEASDPSSSGGWIVCAVTPLWRVSWFGS